MLKAGTYQVVKVEGCILDMKERFCDEPHE